MTSIRASGEVKILAPGPCEVRLFSIAGIVLKVVQANLVETISKH